MTSLFLIVALAFVVRGLQSPWYLLHLALVGLTAWYLQMHYIAPPLFHPDAFEVAVALHLMSINLISFVLFGADKWKARHQRWRIPEKTFQAFVLVGGSFGGILGKNMFRHKTKKISFLNHIYATIIVQILLLIAVFVGLDYLRYQ